MYIALIKVNSILVTDLRFLIHPLSRSRGAPTYGWYYSYNPLNTSHTVLFVTYPVHIRAMMMNYNTRTFMRVVNFNYLKEAYGLLQANGTRLSNKRLRRMAYLDVHHSNYTTYTLYNSYKKIWKIPTSK